MANYSDLMDMSYTAGADLSSKQYYFVKISASGTVTVCAAATDIPCGVLQNAPASGAAAVVRHIGKTKVSSDAALSAGNLIGTSADGQADAKTAGSDTTEYICGQVTVASGGVGEVAEALINCIAPARAA